MKISEILVEAPNDATAKMKQFVQQNKAELNKGQNNAPAGGAVVGKIAPGTLARDTNVAAQRERSVGLDAFGGKGADVSKPAVAKPAAAPAPRGGGADRMPVAKPAAAPAKVSAPARARTALPQASNSNVAGSATNQAAQDKFNQRQPQAVAKKAKQPIKTVGAGGMSDDDRK